MSVEPTERPDPFQRASSIPVLLDFNGLDFVRCAYVTILGRQPDENGANFYSEQLKKGHSKLEILWQLRRSREGRRHDPGLAGLDRLLKRAAWERNPFVGWLVRMGTGGEPDDRLARLQRSILNELETTWGGFIHIEGHDRINARHANGRGGEAALPPLRIDPEMRLSPDDLTGPAKKVLETLAGRSAR